MTSFEIMGISFSCCNFLINVPLASPVKPGNLLCDGSNQRIRLIDFGSAADLDPSPKANAFESLLGGTQRVGYDEGIVAISPVYSAPEFVKLNENPLAFDVFSAGLIMSQLLFNLLDERSEC